MKFDIEKIPFSYYGSYLAFSHPQDKTTGYENQIALRVLYGAFAHQDTYPILLSGNRDSQGMKEQTVSADEAVLSVSSGSDRYDICFADAETILIRANAPVRITRTKAGNCDRVIRHMDGTLEMASEGRSLRLWCRRGRADVGSDVGSDVLLEPEDGCLLVQVTLSGISFLPREAADFDVSVLRVRKEFQEFYQDLRRSVGEINSRFEQGVEEAAYILWHSVIRPEGYVSRPVMLMTKNWMNLVWSWDYTFNALAAVAARPELAYDQYLAMADMQGTDGAYPDAFQAETVIRSFVKPPVQGFMLKQMLSIHDPGREIKEQIYHSVARFTAWWFTYRTEGQGKGSTLPFYCHGNDSGWDNATIFAKGYPVQSPDLAAWLVLQMEFLEQLSKDLGFHQEAEDWKIKGEGLYQDMMEYFVRDDEFHAVKLPEGREIHSQSLILYLPLILGDRLPERLRENMVAKLLQESSIAGRWGFASEPIDSPLFEEDGYWRGAVWPPTTLIMVEALKRCNKTEKAMEFAEKFCDMCAENGFYENYSAVSGQGLRDHGFTWTASVFLILLRDYKMNREV